MINWLSTMRNDLVTPRPTRQAEAVKITADFKKNGRIKRGIPLVPSTFPKELYPEGYEGCEIIKVQVLYTNFLTDENIKRVIKGNDIRILEKELS